eukprot:TRINITY_DN3620_c0_g1_i1.p1 TRINITY_DN3620_c0_g1~~TRINITY_DN3620_c0_g1_i1.p1  ORF type:complete len:159 (-),score=43.13 TRINITY_DN3620_c0_g1_i1:208-684(-)
MTQLEFFKFMVLAACIIMGSVVIVIWVGFGRGRNYTAAVVIVALIGHILMWLIPAMGLWGLYKNDELWIFKFAVGCIFVFLIQFILMIVTAVALTSKCDDPGRSSGWDFFCDVNKPTFIATVVLIEVGSLLGIIFGCLLQKAMKGAKQGKEELNVYLY